MRGVARGAGYVCSSNSSIIAPFTSNRPESDNNTARRVIRSAMVFATWLVDTASGSHYEVGAVLWLGLKKRKKESNPPPWRGLPLRARCCCAALPVLH
jgi:hypothetical protein